jgi:ribosomal protein S27E
LATEQSPQRSYRAACPNCGAPVDFLSPASAFAVCSFCKSTIVRDGDALRKIGESAELFDDHSPLQLGAAGKYQGAAFTLVGRVQYRYAEGTWNEWHALFDGDGGKSGWLSEDNGRYVIAFDAPLEAAAPSAASLQVGQQVVVAGQGWAVGSVSAAKVIAAQGELPIVPNLARGFVIADLRNPRGEVGTLDYTDPAAPRWAIGRSVAISELAMTGLAETAEKTLKARGVECPNCGAALEIKLATTQSIVCHQCGSVVDVSKGVGADLAHYAQEHGGSEPLIPLGSVGALALTRGTVLPWQVVGYVERCEVSDGSDDEQSFWREYLLYNRTEGFAFIVDAQDGWSWTAPITGVPENASNGVRYQGALYRKLYDYTGMVTYVLGEFYWQVTRNQRTYNSDYQGSGAAASKRLNREMTGSGESAEVVWSAGDTLSAEQVMQAFRIAPEKTVAMLRDALPTSLDGVSMTTKIIIWTVIIIVMLILYECSEGGGGGGGYGYRSSGGSYGGFSSGGGGHK